MLLIHRVKEISRKNGKGLILQSLTLMTKFSPIKKFKLSKQQQKITKRLQKNKQKNLEMRLLHKMKPSQYQEKSKHSKHGVKKQCMSKDKSAYNSSDQNIPQQSQKCIQKLTSP